MDARQTNRHSPSWPAYFAGALLLLLSLAAMYAIRRDSLIAVHEFLLHRAQYSAADELARLATFLYPDQRLADSLAWKSRFLRRYHEQLRRRERSEVQIFLD